MGGEGRPISRSAVQPFSRSVQPFSRSAVQPFSRSAVQPFSRSAVQPGKKGKEREKEGKPFSPLSSKTLCFRWSVVGGRPTRDEVHVDSTVSSSRTMRMRLGTRGTSTRRWSPRPGRCECAGRGECRLDGIPLVPNDANAVGGGTASPRTDRRANVSLARPGDPSLYKPSARRNV